MIEVHPFRQRMDEVEPWLERFSRALWDNYWFEALLTGKLRPKGQGEYFENIYVRTCAYIRDWKIAAGWDYGCLITPSRVYLQTNSDNTFATLEPTRLLLYNWADGKYHDLNSTTGYATHYSDAGFSRIKGGSMEIDEITYRHSSNYPGKKLVIKVDATGVPYITGTPAGTSAFHIQSTNDINFLANTFNFTGTVNLGNTLIVAQIYGASSASGNLGLGSTSDSTKGKILFGSGSAYDEANDRIGIGTQAPGCTFDCRGAVVINELGADADVRIEGDNDGNLLCTDASTDRVGIGTAAPDKKLHVNGTSKFGDDITIVDGKNVVLDTTTGTKIGTGTTQKLGFFNANPVVQQAHLADLKIDYTTGDLDSEAEIITAINTTNGRINDILARLELFGFSAAS
jgi:hypothetical protein